MAQRRLIYVEDDNSEISPSPLTILDTLYYETWFRVQGTQGWNQQIDYSPLNTYEVATSPPSEMPCIVLAPLADGTTYEFKTRRFDSDNNFSEWFEDTFTTDQS